MNTFKNAIIAILTGLLALTLSTQNAQSAPAKSYDAVKLIQYETCLQAFNNYDTRMALGYGLERPIDVLPNIARCRSFQPALSATVKTYDAVKLIQYEACIISFHHFGIEDEMREQEEHSYSLLDIVTSFTMCNWVNPSK